MSAAILIVVSVVCSFISLGAAMCFEEGRRGADFFWAAALALTAIAAAFFAGALLA